MEGMMNTDRFAEAAERKHIQAIRKAFIKYRRESQQAELDFHYAVEKANRDLHHANNRIAKKGN